MKSHVNIVVAVDVMGALSDGTLRNGNLCLIDDGSFESRGQGTPDLYTTCLPGQTVQWTVLPLDLQTPADIKGITFLGSNGAGGAAAGGTRQHTADESEKLPLDVWSGVVPWFMTPGVPYRYRLEIQMYEGEASILHVDSPALIRL